MVLEIFSSIYIFYNNVGWWEERAVPWSAERSVFYCSATIREGSCILEGCHMHLQFSGGEELKPQIPIHNVRCISMWLFRRTRLIWGTCRAHISFLCFPYNCVAQHYSSFWLIFSFFLLLSLEMLSRMLWLAAGTWNWLWGSTVQWPVQLCFSLCFVCVSNTTSLPICTCPAKPLASIRICPLPVPGGDFSQVSTSKGIINQNEGNWRQNQSQNYQQGASGCSESAVHPILPIPGHSCIFPS